MKKKRFVRKVEYDREKINQVVGNHGNAWVVTGFLIFFFSLYIAVNFGNDSTFRLITPWAFYLVVVYLIARRKYRKEYWEEI